MDRTIPEVEQKKKEIISRYMFGDSVIELAKEYNLSRERIYQYLRNLEDWEEEREVYEQRKKHQLKIQKRKLQEEVILRIKLGQSITQIARELHIANKTIHILLTGTKYKIGKKALKQRDKKILREYKSGATQKQLAKKYNTAQTNISRIIVKNRNEKLQK